VRPTYACGDSSDLVFAYLKFIGESYDIPIAETLLAFYKTTAYLMNVTLGQDCTVMILSTLKSLGMGATAVTIPTRKPLRS